MVEDSRLPQGSPVWIDLQTTDRDAAAEFYSAVFGWRLSDPDDAAGGFVVASDDHGPIAAIGPIASDLVEQGARGAWTLYLAVDDVDAVVAAVPDAGGRVVLAPGRLGPDVRLAIVTDSAGAVVGLWQGDRGTGWARGEAGEADWFELVGAGAGGALDFYAAALGASVSHMPMGEIEYPLLGAGGVEFAGVDESAPGPVAWRVYFRVDDIDAARGRIVEAGGSVLTDTARFDGVGAWAAARDPHGAVFSVLQPPAADADPPQEGAAQDD